MSLAMMAFRPITTGTVQVAATTTSARVAISGLEGGNACRVYNPGTTGARIEFGTVTITAIAPVGATPGSMMIAPGSVEVLTAPPGTTYVAAKMDTGTATVEFTPGVGL